MTSTTPRSSRSRTIRLLGAFMLASASMLIGCANSSTKVLGRVVPGPVGVATVVAMDDERLSEGGVPGVEVALLRDTGPRGGGVIAKGTTDEEGAFEIVLERGQHPGGAVVVRVKGDRVFDARSRSFLPTAAQRLLCTVIEREQPESP